MVLLATMLLVSPLATIPKVQAIRVAERDMTTLGFRKPKAYGAWMQGGSWRVSLKDTRGHTLLAWVSPDTGRLLYAINKTRYPKDLEAVAPAGSPPAQASNLALMEKVVGTRLRVDRWGESWSNRIESWYEAKIGSRVLIGDKGAIRAYLLQDPISAEPISFGNIPKIPLAARFPDRVKSGDAERIGIEAIRRNAAVKGLHGVKLSRTLPAMPALYLMPGGGAVPVWRVRADYSVATTSFKKKRWFSEDALVNTVSGKVEAIVPRAW